eukprot:4517448-Pyramimonas_sp.AAC.2
MFCSESFCERASQGDYEALLMLKIKSGESLRSLKHAMQDFDELKLVNYTTEIVCARACNTSARVLEGVREKSEER